jgi:hypothetical protein
VRDTGFRAGQQRSRASGNILKELGLEDAIHKEKKGKS